MAGGTDVRMKLWRAGDPEPEDWTIQHRKTGAPGGGSLALVAHRWDVLFETVTVTPV